MGSILTIGRPMMWRRLDLPGHDAASLREAEDGPELHGMAVFLEERSPTALRYTMRCDARWQTIDARVEGWCGARLIDLQIRRAATGYWTLNGAPCRAVAGCVDLDLNFTPATNLLPLRRLDLQVGQAAEVRSAWLEWPAAVLSPLRQRYLRRSATEYEYEADLPGADTFSAVLRVEPGGWVLDYAELWHAESTA